MSIFVIYGSRYGNTQKVAEAIADALREHGIVRLLPADEAAAIAPRPGDLLVIGCPTEGHTMTPAVRYYLDGMGPDDLRGVTAAAFDTRLGWPRWLSGSAAAAISRRLGQLGAHVIQPAGSFVVTGKSPVLVPGELKRASEWATMLVHEAALAHATAGR